MFDGELELCDEVRLHEKALALAAGSMPPEAELCDLAELFKVFGDPTRVRILFVLRETELCVCDIAETLSMTPSAVSHQLKILRDKNLVSGRRAGKTVYYHLADDHVRTIILMGYEHLTEKKDPEGEKTYE